MLRRLPALSRSGRQGKLHCLQSGHTRLPERGEATTSATLQCDNIGVAQQQGKEFSNVAKLKPKKKMFYDVRQIIL